MATVKVKTPRTNLQRTKQANTSSPRSYTPRVNVPRAPYSRGGDSMTNIINTAAAHPAETLGYTLGSYLGNYLERGRDRYQGEEENRILGSVMDKFNNAPQEPFDGDYGKMDMNSNEQGYLASQAQSEPSQAITPQSVAGPYDDAVNASRQATIAGEQALMSGQPMTAAAVNAMGLSPVDQAKQAVVDGRLRDYAEYGPNASRARRQEEQMYQMADQAKNMNLATMPTSQLEAMIDQQLQSSKMSWRRQQDAKANILKRLQQQGEEQANAQAWDMYSKWLTMDQQSDEGKQYATDMLKKGTELANAGRKNAGALLIKPIMEQKAYEEALRRKMAEAEMLGDIKFNQHIRTRDYDASHPVARGRSTSSGTSTSRGGSKKNSGEIDIEKYINTLEKKQRSLADYITKVDKSKANGETLNAQTENEYNNAVNDYKVNNEMLKRLKLGPEQYEDQRASDAFWYYSMKNEDE